MVIAEDIEDEALATLVVNRIRGIFSCVAVQTPGLGVGAPSEAEMKSRKDAYDDAIAATKAASEEGIVPGGGLALLRAIPAVKRAAALHSGEFRTGMLIVRNALESPARTIAHNSGVDRGVVVNAMRQSKGAEAYDAACGQYVDLIAAGIIDPTKVVRVALENAVSIASLLLLTEATMIEVKEPSDRPHMPSESM